MMNKIQTIIFSALMSLTVEGCGTTQTYHNITTEERNHAWQAVPIDRIAVIAVTDDRAERIGSETVFADELLQLGIDTITSYDFAPDLTNIDSVAEAMQTLGERNVDAVLTVAVAQAARGYDPTDYWAARGWAAILGADSRQARGWATLADAASYWGQGEYSLDIGLYDARTLDSIWYAQTDSNEWDAGAGGVQRLADAVADMLVQRGFLKPGSSTR